MKNYEECGITIKIPMDKRLYKAIDSYERYCRWIAKEFYKSFSYSNLNPKKIEKNKG